MANKLFEIEAEFYNAALEQVQEKYKKCEIVLNYNDFVNVFYQDINKQSAEDEKNELILEIIKYLYNDEKKHFLESDKSSRKNHIFPKLERLKSLCI